MEVGGGFCFRVWSYYIGELVIDRQLCHDSIPVTPRPKVMFALKAPTSMRG